MTGADVDLLVSELGGDDATSNHTRLLRDLLTRKDLRARIVVGQGAQSDDEALPLKRWRADASLSILQHSIGSAIAEHVIRQKVPVVLNYHNVTPASFVESWSAEQIAGLRWGREQLPRLAALTRRGIADSHFNARDLLDAAVRDVVVAPVLWQPRAKQPSSPRAAPESDAGTVLFVGRVAPNKCHHDLIAAHAALTVVRPRARLVLVGAAAPPEYGRALESYASALGIAENVTFTGGVDAAELAAWLEAADVMACASEHEGFCVPLLEAMAGGVPVVAFDAAAVPETVGGAGLVLSDKRPSTLAAALDRVLGDEALRASMIALGSRRARDLSLETSSGRMWDALSDLVAGRELASRP